MTEENAALAPPETPVEQPETPPVKRGPGRPKRAYKYKYGARRMTAQKPALSEEARQAIFEQEKALREANLLGADVPEASVLQEVSEDVKAKLSRIEKDKLSLAEALAREAEIDANDDGTRYASGNEFWVDPKIIPAGWHYEWKTDTVLNQRNPAELTALARAGWQAVPRSRHPEMMPMDWPGETIMRGGQILYQLPANLVARRREEDLAKAKGELATKLAQLNGKSAKDLPGAQPRRGTVSREFGPIQGGSETLYQGHIVDGHLVPGGRSIAR